jgi:hypothetical protein
LLTLRQRAQWHAGLPAQHVVENGPNLTTRAAMAYGLPQGQSGTGSATQL